MYFGIKNLFISEKGNLNVHIVAVHEGIKPFKCDTCDANFARKDKLIAHIAAIHEGKKPYKCGNCDARFAQKPNLHGHIAAVHEGKKSFKCVFLPSSLKNIGGISGSEAHFRPKTLTSLVSLVIQVRH